MAPYRPVRPVLLALALLALPALSGCFGGSGVRPADYISDDDYGRWVVEVDYAKGHRPPQSLLDAVRAKLAAVVEKPDGIHFQYGDELADGGTWDQDALEGLSERNQGTRTGGNTVVTHLLVLGGESDSEGVLGVTVGWDLIAIFDATIDEATGAATGGCPIPTLCDTPRSEVELAVYLHEFGHALGLVDRGTRMQRDHEADECQGRPDDGHSSNRDSVMFCQVETSAGLALLTGGPPTSFDEDDKADLKAVRDA